MCMCLLAADEVPQMLDGKLALKYGGQGELDVMRDIAKAYQVSNGLQFSVCSLCLMSNKPSQMPRRNPGICVVASVYYGSVQCAHVQSVP